METLKAESIDAIAKMPDSSTIDDIMYQLYVIDKIRKGKLAVAKGETIPVNDLKKQIEQW